jgi:hypothetical protein
MRWRRAARAAKWVLLANLGLVCAAPCSSGTPSEIGRRGPSLESFLSRGVTAPGRLNGGPDSILKYGNEYDQHDGSWYEYDDHAMRGAGGPIFYSFDLMTVCVSEASLEIGVEFASRSALPEIPGPTLWAWNEDGSQWVVVADSIGNQDELVWKWYTLPSPSTQWITSGGKVYISVLADPDDDVVIDEVGTAFTGIYSDLTITDLWLEPETFCGSDLVDVRFTVRNDGLCDAVGVFYCDLWFDDEWTAFILMDGLAEGDSVVQTIEDFTWPHDDQSHEFYVYVDTDGDIKESDEMNNWIRESFAALGPPSGTSNVQASDGEYADRVEIAWDMVGGATHYEIYRDSVLVEGSWPSSPYNDYGASAGSTHTYQVCACDECGCSSQCASDTGHLGAVPVSLPMGTGWNWFSLNVECEDMSLDSVLASLGDNADYIKDQTSYSEYVPDWSSWFGTLGYLTCETTYLIKMNSPGTLEFAGVRVEADTPLPLATGWNWVPYLPSASMGLDEALASLEDHGTYIKDQLAYAEYVPDWSSWFGTLTEMEPLEGYKIRMASPDVLIYPGPGAQRSRYHVRRTAPQAAGTDVGGPDWRVVPGEYEHTGSVTASVTSDGDWTADGKDLLAAFVESECRGVQRPCLTPDGRYVFFLTLYSNKAQGESLHFRFYDASKGSIHPITQTIEFAADMTRGGALSPLALRVETEREVGDKAMVPRRTMLLPNHPDPFYSETLIRFTIGATGHAAVQIFNVQGEAVTTLVDGTLTPALYTVVWDGRDESGESVPSGTYFCRLRTHGHTSIEKVVIVR